MRTLSYFLCWALYTLSTLLLGLWLAWHASAQMNFLYPVWYSVLGIDQTIVESAPRNRYKENFSNTTREEHHRLFGEIVSAVQAKGKGLAQIEYFSPHGESQGPLLTPNEIIHLNDVARLVNTLNWFSLVLLVCSLLAAAIIFLFRLPMPALRTIFITTAGFVTAALMLLLVVGPTRIFYWLHTIVFPDDHQWFFYYEESLMSMLMKAPALFAPIGMQLLILGLFIWGMHLYLLEKSGLFKSA